MTPLRPVHWIGPSLDELRACPERVEDLVGYALDTPRHVLALIQQRFRQAQAHHALHYGKES